MSYLEERWVDYGVESYVVGEGAVDNRDNDMWRWGDSDSKFKWNNL